MNDQGINEAVARKLGWKECQCGSDVSEEHKRYMPSKHEMPDYCTYIKVAWEIVEKIEDYYFVLSRADKRRWKVETDGITIYANTAPMAICLAFLKLQ